MLEACRDPHDLTLAPPRLPSTELPGFVAAVEARAKRRILDSSLPLDQRERLALSFRAPTAARLLGHQMTPFYCLVAAHGRALGDMEIAAGAAFMLIQRGISMIDKVQDDDRDDLGPWLELGPGATLNAGITAMVLGIDALWEIEQRCPEAPPLRARVHAHLLTMSAGQHRELVARPDRLPVRERIEIAGQKATEFALLTELAGICAGARELEAYRGIGQELAIMIQIVNDLADLSAPGPSDDLRTGTWNIPLTLLLESMAAEEATQWESLLTQAGARGGLALAAIKSRGLLKVLADRVETSCLRIHRALAQTPCSGPYLAMLSMWIDDLASLLYRAPPREHLLVHMDPSLLHSDCDRAIQARFLAALHN